MQTLANIAPVAQVFRTRPNQPHGAGAALCNGISGRPAKLLRLCTRLGRYEDQKIRSPLNPNSI